MQDKGEARAGTPSEIDINQREQINELDRRIELLNNERSVANQIISKQKTKIRALMRRTGKPSTEQMKIMIDENRFKSSGRVNYAAVGQELRVHGNTAKKWIQELGLSAYGKE